MQSVVIAKPYEFVPPDRRRFWPAVLQPLLRPVLAKLWGVTTVEFVGIEPEDTRHLLADPRDLAASFARESLALRERWRLTCLESRVEYLFATTSTPPAEVLRAFLFERRRARR